MRLGPRAKGLGQSSGDLGQAWVAVGGLQARARDDVAHHVTARTERRHELLVEGTGERAQAVLYHTVKLHRLSSGQSDRPVGDARRDPVEGQPLVGGHVPTRDDNADHEDVVKRLLGEGPLPANVAIVLGVDAVELEDLLALVRDSRQSVVELDGDAAAQEVARSLDALDLGLLLRVDCHNRFSHRGSVNFYKPY
jgi:hypothetical protein